MVVLYDCGFASSLGHTDFVHRALTMSLRKPTPLPMNCNRDSRPRIRGSWTKAPRLLVALGVFFIWLLLPGLTNGQVNVVTYHNDVARTGLNPSETILNPANVNSGSFGFLFAQSVDGMVVGQPLYMSNISIPGLGVHNVVYVATLHDSVYAFDADNSLGSNGTPLWQVNFTNPAAGITTASGTALPCQGVTTYQEAGIVSTPVIDPATGTIYVIAKTNENGTVFHRLHALDITTGQERANSPVAIAATFTANNGAVVKFNSLHAMNRPALLLNNGVIYAAFGSNGCNDSAYGWVIAYNATAFQQVGVFNASPGKGLASIWQSGSGPAADNNGNVYVSTSESDFTGNTGGQDFGMSILKLSQGVGALNLADYFTPHNQAALTQADLDVSSCGTMVLPDQPGPNIHLLVGSGKEGTVYLLNRDNMGQYNSSADTQIVQELASAVGAMFSTPAYWNSTVYFAGNSHPIQAYSLSGGLLSTLPVAQSAKMPGAHAPTISANGNTNGVLWAINGPALYAFDATTLKMLYNTNQAGTRDLLPSVTHFVTQTVANGKVYVGTKQSLAVYGLLHQLTPTSGNNQSVTVNSALPVPLQVQAVDPYTGQTFAGVTVTFSDGGKGGVFGNPTAITDSSGLASTTYSFYKVARTVTITASSPGLANALFTETGTPDVPKWLTIVSGNNQTATAGSNLPAPLVVKASDQYSNGIPGISVNFTDGGAGGTLSAASVITDSKGHASVNYTTPTKAGTVIITASSPGLASPKFSETAN
jgi:Big-like domain-containing protein